MENIIEYFNIVTALIALCAAIAAITHTPKGNTLSRKLYKILDCIALNFGLAKEDPKQGSDT
jgi:hypothetical protein